MLTPFWVTFTNRQASVCVEASSVEAARIVASEVGPVDQVRDLPYPASPRLGAQSDCPAFCYAPDTCAGRSACPKSYACSE